ncbi:F-box/LRR-repeat protein 12-like [Tubulanus polymorphus]|uniref:F-box/LRR-repeat protein 12-like n=1 Tax=Tubulanus polymorphus TaxID=672921 RepID=UPI003DA437E6
MAAAPACIQNLPENLILDIFKHLPIKDRCRICRVCRQWRRIVHDKKLWKHVDLMDHPLNLTKLWTFVRSHFSDCLLSLKMKGFMYSKVGAKKWKKATLSDAMLKELQERCPNLQELCMSHANLESVNSSCFPIKLKKLTIISSCLPFNKAWLDENFIPELTHLDLSYTPAVTAAFVKGLGTRTKLISLKLNGCYRLTGSLYDSLWELFPNLEVLELSSTCLTDVSIHHICRFNLKLRHFNMSDCTQVTELGLANILQCLSHLQSLNISKCSISLNENVVVYFKNFKVLNYLNIKGNSLTKEIREKLFSYLDSYVNVDIEETL